jgi:hypothetical protein
MEDFDEFVKEHSDARGLAIVICNNYETCSPYYGPLPGTFKDGDAMESTFKALGFATILLQNVTGEKMRNAVHALAAYQNYPEKYNCFGIVFCGHGSNDKIIISSDGESVNFEEAIIRPLHPSNSPLIRKRPKIVFIDACRGSLQSRGPEPARIELSLPDNVFVAHSTMDGHMSFEGATGGIWMQELAIKLKTSCKSVGDTVADVNEMMRERKLQVPQIWNTSVSICLADTG